MVVEYKGCKTVFDDKWVSTVSYEEFEAVCLSSKPFKLMLKKERINKIKEVYGRVNRVSEKTSKDKHRENVSGSDKGKRKGNSGTEQRATSAREEHQKPKDNTEISEQHIRKEESKDKS